MRVIGGKWRGQRLADLSDKVLSSQLRPTMDRVRETTFNILAHGLFFELDGVRVLDLFCGTGSLGFEALSRGAKHCCFIDIAPMSLRIVNENTSLLKANNEVTILKQDATNLTQNVGDGYDLIFLDPPYGKGFGALALKIAIKRGWVSTEAMVVWEERDEVALPDELNLIRRKPIGNVCLNFFRKSY